MSKRIRKSSNQRQTYHTNIKLLAKLGLLPEEIRKSIPRSNISRWKDTNFSSVVGEKYPELEISLNLKKIINTIKKDAGLKKEFVKLIAKDENLFGIIKEERKEIYDSYR